MPAILLAWTGIDAAEEDAFNAWYNHEHMRDRVLGVPGFLRGRRFVAVSGGPRYLALYETTGPDVLTSDAYVGLIAEPDPKSRHFIMRFRQPIRTIGRLAGTYGESEGASLALIPLATDEGWEGTRDRLLCETLPALVGTGGIVAAHLIERDEAAAANSTRRHVRQGDRSLAAALLVESADVDIALEPILARIAAPLPTDPALPPAVFRLLYRVAPPAAAAHPARASA